MYHFLGRDGYCMYIYVITHPTPITSVLTCRRGTGPSIKKVLNGNERWMTARVSASVAAITVLDPMLLAIAEGHMNAHHHARHSHRTPTKAFDCRSAGLSAPWWRRARGTSLPAGHPQVKLRRPTWRPLSSHAALADHMILIHV